MQNKKLLEDNVGENLDEFGYGNDLTPKVKIHEIKNLISWTLLTFETLLCE